MFDEIFGLAASCDGGFREGVHDAFGASIVADVLEPILKEIHSLRIFNADFTRQTINIDRALNDARAIQFKNSGWTR